MFEILKMEREKCELQCDMRVGNYFYQSIRCTSKLRRAVHKQYNILVLKFSTKEVIIPAQ